MKPVLFYVDDEPHNLVVLEAACPDEWEVHTFESGMAALEKLDVIKPHVIITDQRMPGMTGVQFLEVARKIQPDAIRIIVTGYSDEDLVVQSVRKAQIFDYLKKPWDVDDLLASIERGIEYYNANQEKKRLEEELLRREQELRETNTQLTHALRDLELARRKEAEIRKELECWVPPFVLWAIQDAPLAQSMKRDIVAIAFDIVDSSRLHNIEFNGRPLRGHVIQLFSESVLRHGGWRESHSGDSAYGHFGLAGDGENAAESAFAAAREFRVAMENLSDVCGVKVECGISLHIARACPVFIHTVHLNTPRGPITQKSFDTSSADVDLLHRMEKLVHTLPGTNIVMSQAFMERLKHPPADAVAIGSHRFQGQTRSVDLFVLAGEETRAEDVEKLKDRSQSQSQSKPGDSTGEDSAA